MKNTCLLLITVFFFSNTICQVYGDRVSFVSTDGKTYTGTISSIYNGQYKIRYDGSTTEAWMVPSQFKVLTTNVPNENNRATTNNNWRVGDKVEVFDMYTNRWENGTVTVVYADRTPIEWRVRIDADAVLSEIPVKAENIRSRNAAASAPAYHLNDRVDVYYSYGDAHGHATIVSVLGNGQYKVHYDGCDVKRDENVDFSQLKPETKLSPNSADVSVLMGNWAMFVYSYPTTVTRGDNLYREYGTGAKAPPLRINANGTYVWYDEFNKPPVKGTWFTHAAMPGVRYSTDAYNGIVLLDSHGVYWKIRKDREDHIEARTLCSGLTQGGTRIK